MHFQTKSISIYSQGTERKGTNMLLTFYYAMLKPQGVESEQKGKMLDRHSRSRHVCGMRNRVNVSGQRPFVRTAFLILTGDVSESSHKKRMS